MQRTDSRAELHGTIRANLRVHPLTVAVFDNGHVVAEDFAKTEILPVHFLQSALRGLDYLNLLSCYHLANVVSLSCMSIDAALGKNKRGKQNYRSTAMNFYLRSLRLCG
jgi:hypothetical protein